MLMDDTDIWGSIKFWANHTDKVLCLLSTMLINRQLFKVHLTNERIGSETYQDKLKAASEFGLSKKEAKYFVKRGKVSNSGYIASDEKIKVLSSDGLLTDVALATDLPNIKAISKIVEKNYLCWPKSLSMKKLKKLSVENEI